jgi:glycerate kinase
MCQDRAMRILVAPDSFGGTLSAMEAAAAIAAGWHRTAPQDDIDLCPLADGGPGFVSTLEAGLGGTLLSVTISSPLGDPVPGALLLVEGPAGPTAYLESGQATGLPLVPVGRRDPTVTTTFGVGQLIQAALDAGARRIVVGLGGSATNDAGAGMLAALGAGWPERAALGAGRPDGVDLGAGRTEGAALGAAGRSEALASGGGRLGEVVAADLAGLAGLRRRLADVELVAAFDVDVPLLGLHGASAGFATQKGARPEQAQDLERALGHFSQVAVDVLGDAVVRPDLLAGTRRTSAVARLTSLPGAGAAGGLGFGLAVLGARLVPGSALVADAVGLPARLRAVDLVVTGEGTFDWQSLRGKVVQAVAERAMSAAVPTVVLAGQMTIGRREWGAAGIAGAYAVATTADEVAASMADPAGTLAARAARVARTWSH